MDESLDLRISSLDGIKVSLANFDSRRLAAVQQQPDLIDGEFLKLHSAPWASERAAHLLPLRKV
jgi:hypothetical protein